jgi:hypothetical protein
MAGLLVVAAVMLLGMLDLSRKRLPDGIAGLLAAHWQAGQPVDCRLCPARLFVVVCDAGKQVHIRSLQQLAALQADSPINRQGTGQREGADFPCIENRSFRLARPSGAFGGPYDPADPGFRQDISFQVLRESAGVQVVEVRYQDSRTDIDDALFRYEVSNGTIRPLESWVLTRGHFAALLGGAIAVVVLLLLGGILYFGVTVLWRRIGSRRRRS